MYTTPLDSDILKQWGNMERQFCDVHSNQLQEYFGDDSRTEKIGSNWSAFLELCVVKVNY